MRIIAGEARGRRLKSVKGQKTRPTADRVKESLFSILTPLLQNANFLDLFAGTGSIGMEAISRGVNKSVFVDSSEAAVRVIGENLRVCGFCDRATVIKSDVLDFLKRTSSKEEQFDLVFVDPPYDIGLVQSVLKMLAGGNLISDNGIVIVEARKGSVEADIEVERLQKIRKAVYGDTVLVFYRKQALSKGDLY